MEGSSRQSGSSSSNKKPTIATAVLDNSNYENGMNLSGNQVLLKLEENGFTTPDDKVEELLKNLNKPKCLYTLKILFENTQIKFSSQVLTDSLVALADPTPFNHYSKESVARLELHLRTLVTGLERICFSPIRLTRKTRENIYNSLANFAEIHRKATQVIEEGLENNFKTSLNIAQQQRNDDDDNYVKKRNYNIDFLLIHIRDTLHSLRDDETWFQEILRRVKDILKAALGVTPGILATTTGVPCLNDNYSILSMLSQLRQGLCFKYPVASYYVDWRIMLIIQHNIDKWSLSSEKIISKKFGEMILMEYFWSYVEREWINISDKSILDSQANFEELFNKVIKALKNTESFLNDLAGNEPLALPHTLWFGILDLAHNLIQKSTRKATHGLCYYLAIESLNKAPSSFIQFKAIEILLYLYNINNELFSVVDLDFDQYVKKLNEINSSNESSKKFQNLVSFIKDKYLEDLEIINNDAGKGKRKEKEKSSVQNITFKHEQIDNSNSILDHIVNEIICPITYEPADQLCTLECQHVISLNNLRKLKQAKCPICQQKIIDINIRYLPQNTIYKNLYSQFFEAGHILPSIETENQYSDESEDDMILIKKKQLIRSIKSIKFNSNISLQSIFKQVRNSKKQHPIYQIVLKELEEKNYEKAVLECKEFLEKFPKSYSIRCILAYTYRFLNKYDEALFYLEEGINLKRTNSIAWYIRGEIFFRQNNYYESRDNLHTSIKYKTKMMNNVHIILGKIYFLLKEKLYDVALCNFEIVLQNDPNNYLCLKHCAYIYEIQENYLNALGCLDKLLRIDKDNSLILCYYGEILFNLEKYDEAILHFNKANDIDPENTHVLCKKAIAYNYLEKYEEALSDINKALSINKDDVSLVLYYGEILSNMKRYDKALSYFTKANNINPENIYILYKRAIAYNYLEKHEEALLDIDKAINLDSSNNSLSYINLFKPSKIDFYLYYHHYKIIHTNVFSDLGIVDNFNMHMYKVRMVYYVLNLRKSRGYHCEVKSANSLVGKVIWLSNYCMLLPKLPNIWESSNYYIVWKIFINYSTLDKFNSIQFIIKSGDSLATYYDHKLRYDDFSKLPKGEWFEYTLPFTINTAGLQWVQPSIEMNGFHINIDAYVDYIRFTPNKQDSTFISMRGLPNIPEAFKERYFPKKEMENLLELKDIISNL